MLPRIINLSIFLFLLNICTFSSALYFHIAETERKCFIEEIPDETTVIGKSTLKFSQNLLLRLTSKDLFKP